VSSRKYPYPPWKDFSFNQTSFASYFPLKNYAFENPLPLGISVNLPWGGMDIF